MSKSYPDQIKTHQKHAMWLQTLSLGPVIDASIPQSPLSFKCTNRF